MQLVKVYDGDFIGWTLGYIQKRLNGNRAVIETTDTTNLIRHIKFGNTQKDGSAYPINVGDVIKAKINFDAWEEEFNMQAESWDNPNRFRELYLSLKDTVLEFELQDGDIFVTKNIDEYEAICMYDDLILIEN